MSLVIVAASSWLLKVATQEPVFAVNLRRVKTRKALILCLPLRIRAPRMVLYLLLDKFSKVDPFIKGVRFSPRIADPTFCI